MYSKFLAIMLAFLCLYLPSLSQDSKPTLEKITGFPSKFFKKVNEKAASLESKLDKQAEKYLERLLKKEKKLRKKLARKDSTAASLLNDAEEQYARLGANLRNKANTATGRNGQYIPYLDSLKTSLSFLDKNNGLIPGQAGIQQKINSSLKQVKGLQSSLQQSEQVKAFIRQRKEYLKQALAKHTNVPKHLSKIYNDFNKELYYYSTQVTEYKEMLNDPDKLTRKGIELLGKTSVFQQFMREHSELAALFRTPDNYGTPQALAGLQTRQQVQQLIQTQLGSAGPNAQQVIQQNMQTAQQQLGRLKDKLNKLGSNNSGDIDADMPDFKPNNQKTKSFFQRLEWGTNLQSTKSNFFFPTTTDLGLSIGYKLSDKSMIGVGGSYKVGWGKDIRQIQVTSEGAGLRSFLDIKLKGSFFASGGFEYNYQGFSNDSLLINQPANKWTQSGLVGISKVISLKTKFFKKTKVQLLWDFLSYQQVPRTQALRFRVGYSF
jgi:hypothetical protein